MHLPADVIGTHRSGNSHASAAYRWTLNHTVAVDDNMELFKTHMIDVGA